MLPAAVASRHSRCYVVTWVHLADLLQMGGRQRARGRRADTHDGHLVRVRVKVRVMVKLRGLGLRSDRLGGSVRSTSTLLTYLPTYLLTYLLTLLTYLLTYLRLGVPPPLPLGAAVRSRPSRRAPPG